MIVKEHFTPRNCAQMGDVWYDVFNHFVDLQDNSHPYIDENGNEWFYVKFDKYLFINIVKTLYEKLNTHNSRHLVKELHDQLRPSVIQKERFCIAKVDKLQCNTDSHITEYERNIIFGALYYVLYRQQDVLVEPSVVEKVKQHALYPNNPYPHYVDYFIDKLSEEPQIHEYEQSTEDSSIPNNEDNYSELEKADMNIEIEKYMEWIGSILDQQIQNLQNRDLIELNRIQTCLEECKKTLKIGVDPRKCGIEIDIPKNTSPDTIKTYIKERFLDIYTIYFSEKDNLQQTPSEGIQTAPTPQPKEEHIVEPHDTIENHPIIDNPTKVDEESLRLKKREQALALIMSCEEYFKLETKTIVTKAFEELSEKQVFLLDGFLASQSFLTTVCRMIGVIKEENLLKTTVNNKLASHIAKKNNFNNADTIASYIGKTKKTSQKELLMYWRGYLKDYIYKNK